MIGPVNPFPPRDSPLQTSKIMWHWTEQNNKGGSFGQCGRELNFCLWHSSLSSCILIYLCSNYIRYSKYIIFITKRYSLLTSIKLLNRFKCSKLYKSTIEGGMAKIIKRKTEKKNRYIYNFKNALIAHYDIIIITHNPECNPCKLYARDMLICTIYIYNDFHKSTLEWNADWYAIACLKYLLKHVNSWTSSILIKPNYYSCKYVIIRILAPWKVQTEIEKGWCTADTDSKR